MASSTDDDSDASSLLGTHMSDDEADTSRRPRERAIRAADPEKQAKFSHGQEPLDAQGRKRFHGAFTGGFSAGYYNTVGSEEGWAPSEWRSSRGERSSSRPVQRAEDFMDEEDMAAIHGAASLVSRAEYARPASQPLKPTRPQPHDVESEATSFSASLGQGLSGLLQPSSEARGVGHEILRRLGWREGFGVGPRVRRRKQKVARAPSGAKIYGCDLGPLARARGRSEDDGSDGGDEDNEDDEGGAAGGWSGPGDAVSYAPRAVSIVDFSPKLNLHGVGYDPYRDAPEFERRRVALGGGGGAAPISGRRPQAAFTGDEDDVDPFGGTDMSQFNTTIDDDPVSTVTRSLHGSYAEVTRQLHGSYTAWRLPEPVASRPRPLRSPSGAQGLNRSADARAPLLRL